MITMKPLWLRVLVALAPVVLVALCVGVGWLLAEQTYSARMHADRAGYERTLAELQADLADAKAEGERKAREAERKSIADMAELSADFHERERRAEQRISQLGAAVRAGDLRLRERFACQGGGEGGAGGVPEAGTVAAGAGIAVPRGFGLADANAAVRIADEGDARTRRLNWCVRQLIADRQAGASGVLQPDGAIGSEAR